MNAFTWTVYEMPWAEDDVAKIHYAHRQGWRAGKILESDRPGVFTIEPAFPVLTDFFPTFAGLTLERAKERFEDLFNLFLTQSGLRLTLPALTLTWVEKDGRHYGLSHTLLVFIIHQKDGQWLVDDFLPNTNIHIDDQDAWYTKRLPEMSHFDTMDPKPVLRDVNWFPVDAPVGVDPVDFLKNKCSLILTGWLTRSAFMMRFDPNSLPVGREV